MKQKMQCSQIQLMYLAYLPKLNINRRRNVLDIKKKVFAD